MRSLENQEIMIADPTKVEFLEYCRMVLKGEQPAEGLSSAISAARANLERLKQSYLEHVSTLSEAVQEKARRDIDESLAAIDGYFKAVEVVEGYLKDKDRVTLIRGMEFVRRSLDRLNVAFYRHRSSVLAAEGPTDMPNYNLFVRLFSDYKEGKTTEKEIVNLMKAARFAADQAITAMDRFKNIPEVERLVDAFRRHQEALQALEESLLTKKPWDKPLELFRDSCEACRDLQGPAQIKMLSQGPTPSEAANRMINISFRILNGTMHPAYFSENLKQLEGEYEYFRRQFETLKSASSQADSDMLKDAFQESRTGMELYEKAIHEFHNFEERMDTSILIGAVKILQDAVLKLYNVYKQVSDLSEREGKTLCLRCQHYNPAGRNNCEKCGSVLPKMMEGEQDLTSREVREALLSMPMTENIKSLLEAGESVSQGNLSKPEFQQVIVRMEDLLDKSIKQVEDTRRSESKKRPGGFTDNEESAYNLLKNGVSEMREGLSRYSEFIEKEDLGLIVEGSKRIVLGAHKIYQVGKYAYPNKV